MDKLNFLWLLSADNTFRHMGYYVLILDNFYYAITVQIYKTNVLCYIFVSYQNNDMAKI